MKTYAIRSALLAVLVNAAFLVAVNQELGAEPKMFQRAAELHVDCTTDEECQALCEACRDDNEEDCSDILKSN